ncbi:MAG: hypothetical protein K6E51_01070 [Treponema sp.]|nr:hypothetical protein [Treponema sp.]
MAQKSIRLRVSDAFTSFEKQLQRFTSKEDKAVAPIVTSQTLINQKHIGEFNERYKKAIVKIYKKFLSPYEVLGKTSSEADEITKDKHNLVAAYNLYKAMQDLNAQFGTDETYLKALSIESPLIHRDRYTIGDQFIYLLCWFMFENHITDYLPRITVKHQVGQKDVYELEFISAESYRLNYRYKEIKTIIGTCFYPGS